jgi:glycosyltransferase involved in cell wall biosynthesis
MRVVGISTYDAIGGAGRAAYRLHRGLLALGVESRLHVQKKMLDDETVVGPQGRLEKITAMLRPHMDGLPLYPYGKRHETPWTVGWWPTNISRKVNKEAPDVVHLHWTGAGFLSVKGIASLGPSLVWTLHDSWPFTGGCHVAGECERYLTKCGSCPQLGSRTESDISRTMWMKRNRSWRDMRFTFVAPSNWMADCARRSALLQGKQVHVIPNGLDSDRFKPADRMFARSVLGLPSDKKLVLFVGMDLKDQNKGFALLLDSLSKLSVRGHTTETELIVVGCEQPRNPLATPVHVHYLGRLNDDWSLALAYAAADVACVPSLSESFGQVASEALSCGCPVVAFATTGLTDVVEHQANGYLANRSDTDDFARGIAFVLENEERRRALATVARKTALTKFDIRVVAKQYHSLYQESLHSSVQLSR